jgi:hypothetical protein
MVEGAIEQPRPEQEHGNIRSKHGGTSRKEAEEETKKKTTEEDEDEGR